MIDVAEQDSHDECACCGSRDRFEDISDVVIEQAWALLGDHGEEGVSYWIAARIHSTPVDKRDVIKGWLDIATGIDAVCYATRH